MPDSGHASGMSVLEVFQKRAKLKKIVHYLYWSYMIEAPRQECKSPKNLIEIAIRRLGRCKECDPVIQLFIHPKDH